MPEKPRVSSLLDAMVDGREYSSLLEVLPDNINLVAEFRRGIADIEAIRGRPCLCYVSNVVRAGELFTSIELADDLPFAEMVASVSADAKEVDVFVVTPGGSAQQVSSFVHKLRPRFDTIAFLVPHMCMSAGTIWAMSGDEIVMDERGFLGPIDPQVRNRENSFVPAQALFTLLKKIQEEGQRALSNGHQPPWSDIQLLRLIDPKELGNAIASTKYAEQLVADYLEKFKFRDWTTHSSDQRAVTAEDRKKTAAEIAGKLASHEAWKTHSHGIFHNVLWDEIRLKISLPDPTLTRTLRRLWALYYWSFENSEIRKIFVAKDYALMKINPVPKAK